MNNQKTIHGIVLILQTPDGRIKATETDFHQSFPSGYTLQEEQIGRAKIGLMGNVLISHCSRDISDVLTSDSYLMSKIEEQMIKKGWKLNHKNIEIPINEKM